MDKKIKTHEKDVHARALTQLEFDAHKDRHADLLRRLTALEINAADFSQHQRANERLRTLEDRTTRLEVLWGKP